MTVIHDLQDTLNDSAGVVDPLIDQTGVVDPPTLRAADQLASHARNTAYGCPACVDLATALHVWLRDQGCWTAANDSLAAALTDILDRTSNEAGE